MTRNVKRLIIFAAAAIVIGAAGLIALGIWWTGPPLAATVTFPAELHVDEGFYITVAIINPNRDTVELDNIEIPLHVFDFLDIRGSNPPANSTSPFDIFGLRVWKYDKKIPPGGALTVELSARATGAITDTLSIGVCNHYEDCTRTKTQIRITHEFLESPNR